MPMRSIAVINQKGGVGKTTTAVNVSAALARRGQRVLLLDLDPQAHATLHVGVSAAGEDTTIYDVLARGAALLDAMRTVAPNLVLVPSHIDLVAADVELGQRDNRELLLRTALQSADGHFDYCIIDCPPSLGTATINALAASDEVIIPLQPHFLGLQGLGKLLETVSLVRGVLQPTLRVSGVVLCMYESATRLAREVRADVSQFIRDAEYQDAWYGARVFETAIRKNIKLAESPSFGQTIFDYAADSHGAEDYAALVEEIVAMAAEAAPGAIAEAAQRPSVSASDACNADAAPLEAAADQAKAEFAGVNDAHPDREAASAAETTDAATAAATGT